jgi:hypothetical protein
MSININNNNNNNNNKSQLQQILRDKAAKQQSQDAVLSAYSSFVSSCLGSSFDSPSSILIHSAKNFAALESVISRTDGALLKCSVGLEDLKSSVFDNKALLETCVGETYSLLL